MERKIRVCCFCEKWESGGIESFLFNTITHMERQNLEIDIVAAKIGDSIFKKPLEDLGIRFFELSGNCSRLFKNRECFCRILSKHDYDVLHLNVFHGLSLYYARLASAMGVQKVIAHSHNSALRKTVASPVKLLVHKLSKQVWAKYADEYWACSDEAAQFLFPPGIVKDKYEFIPNGINIDRFKFSDEGRRKARRELGVADEALLLGNVGRLSYQKNQKFLIDVMSELHKLKPCSCLLLVGEGELKEKIIKRAKKLKLENHVIFYGLTENVEALLWAMDLFVFPSRFEGLGIAAVEAQAAGLPVLCSEHVPQKALMTDNFKRLSLASGAKAWAKELCSMTAGTKRLNDEERNKIKSFDINYAADLIAKKYSGEIS